jgi:hypothetical protein
MTPVSLTYNNTSIPLGATHKVIRWAFERRGAYYFLPQVSPFTNYNPAPFPGPNVDVFIYQGGIMPGEYAAKPNFWTSPDIFNRLQADGSSTTPDQPPVLNTTNYLYVKVSSRGQAWPSDIVVKLYKSAPAGGNVWPNDWSAFSTPTELTASPSPTATDVVVGPFQWTPTSGTFHAHICILATVSTIQLKPSGYVITDDDKANTESILSPIPDWHLIPNDNNIAQRNMFAIPAYHGSETLPASMGDAVFLARNPFNNPLDVTFEVTLPELLKSKGWSIGFDTGNHVELESFDREGVLITPEVTEGEAFTRDEVLETNDRNIVIYMNTEFGCIGGMTYYLDPDYREG